MRRLLVATGLLLSLAARAAADDGPGPRPLGPGDGAADRLTPEEVDALRRRLPQWDVLESAARERIAKNVQVWKSLKPDERARVLERTRRLRAGSVPKEEVSQRMAGLGRLRGDDLRHARVGRLFVRAAWLAIEPSLSPEARRLVTELPEPERLGLDVCVSSLWRKTAVDVASRRPLSEATLSPDAPEPLRRRFERAREAALADGGDVEARRAVAAAVFEDRVRRLRARAEVDGPRGARAFADALVADLRADTEVFDTVLRTVSDAAAKGPEGIAALCESLRPRRKGPPRDRALADIVRAIEARRGVLSNEGAETLAQADALQVRLLGALQVPPAEIEALTAARTKRERDDALRHALRRVP